MKILVSPGTYLPVHMPSSVCTVCRHAMFPHLMLSFIEEDPYQGGQVTCPRLGCRCFQYWEYDERTDKVYLYLPKKTA